jgi:short-subunit dehydrogenase
MGIPSPTSGAAAVITGASSGIGRELARQLARRGHDVVLIARRESRLTELAQELRATGRRAEVIAADVSCPNSRAAIVDRVAELGLTPDVVALCAGFAMKGEFTEHDPDRLQLMLRTNIEGVIGLSRAFVPGMRARRRGALLIMSSVVGNQPMPLIGAYSATKAALTSFGEALHEEVRRDDVSVTVVCPGVVLTEFSEVAEMTATAEMFPKYMTITPQSCAAAAVRAMDRGRRHAVPRVGVQALHFVGGHAPRGLWLRMARNLIA